MVRTLALSLPRAGVSHHGWELKIYKPSNMGKKKSPALAQPGKGLRLLEGPEHQATNPAAKVLHEASFGLMTLMGHDHHVNLEIVLSVVRTSKPK